VPLEQLFDKHDRHKQEVKQTKLEGYGEINIGSEDCPKLIKVGKGTFMEEIKQIQHLIREY
jgi:hypothetical protein